MLYAQHATTGIMGKGQKLLAAEFINTLHCVLSPSSHSNRKGRTAKGKRSHLSTLGKAKLDVSGLCTQAYKDTVLSQTNADLQSG